MEPIGIVVIAVLVLSVVAGLVIARRPPDWDQLGGESPVPPGGEPLFSPRDDEDDLRAVVAAKRARRRAAGGAPVASDAVRDAAARSGHGQHPWAHVESELVEEARELVARRRERLERTGKPVPDEHAELTRLLGPPHV